MGYALGVGEGQGVYSSCTDWLPYYNFTLMNSLVWISPLTTRYIGQNA